MAPAPDMFPVRVMVETVRSQHCLGCAHDGNTLVDTFAVVGGQTMLSQLVETVLSALGLPQLVQDSKGMIQINGWKAISFETITDNPEELVTNLFREISTHITLKILAKRSSSEPNGQCITELKHRLLKTAIEKQPQILTTSNGEEVKEILQQVIQGDQQCSTWSSREQADAVSEWLEQMAAVQHHQNDGSGEGGGGGSVNRKSPLCSTRFSPLSELPRLERWFRSDPNPPRQKLLNYMNILNGSPYRRANNKVSYQQICNWFINQRRQRQQQQSSTELQQKQQKQQRQPMAMLPLNATGAMGTIAAAAGTNNNTTNLALLNSLTSALANGTVDAAQIQHKMAAIFAGMGDEFVAQAQKEWAMGENHHDHQIPLANGLPIDIRSKFEHAASIVERENGNGGGGEGTSNQPQQQEGQQSNGGGQHSDRMDGGSESPMGNDDMSEHSGISGGGPMDGTRDSAAYSSAEELLFMDIQQQRQHNNSIGISTNNRPILMVNQQEEHQMPAPTMAVDNEHNMSIDIVGNDHQLHLDQNAATTAAIKLSQLFQNGQQTPPPPNSSVAMAAAAAAFQTLMPTQTQLHLMNHLAMASQFQQQQCLSPGTPQPPPGTNFGSGSSSSLGGGSGAGPSSSAIKSSPSSNSLSGLGRDRERAESAGGSGNGDFSSPSHGNGSNSRQNDGSGNGQSRSRLMFDPLSELPILERWFEENPHPGWLQIEQYTDFLNSMSYRQNYPPISTHNVKIWFKNRRAKTKRLLGNSDGLT